MPALTGWPVRQALLALALILGGCASQVQLPAQSERLPSRVELTEVPFYPQDEYQCGPAALATMLVQRGVSTSPEQLKPQVYLPQRKGSLKLELVAAARQHGMLVYPLQPNLDALLTQVAAGNPVLVMQNLGFDWYPQWHFAVVVGFDRSQRELVLRSATVERWTTDFTSFDKTWARAKRWAVVTLPPDRLPQEAQLQPWLQAASDLEETGRRTDAERAYRTAAEHWPDEAMPALALGNARHAEGDRVGAEAALRDSIHRQPDFTVGWFNLGELLNERGCPQQAAVARTCAQQLAPDDARFKAPLGASAKAANGSCTALPQCPAL